MTDPRYTYTKINAIKIIVKSDNGKILLIREPETNEWMPRHWGLPGGKTLEKESLYKAFKRKIMGDLGVDLEPGGIVKIEELLMDGRTVLMFHTVVNVKDEIDVKGEVSEFKWADKSEVEGMDLTEFTEYFNKDLILDCISGDLKPVDFDLIETHNFFEMEGNPDYKRWLESGSKRN